MKNLKYTLFTAALSVAMTASFSSCSDSFLDEKNKSSYTTLIISKRHRAFKIWLPHCTVTSVGISVMNGRMVLPFTALMNSQTALT